MHKLYCLYSWLHSSTNLCVLFLQFRQVLKSKTPAEAEARWLYKGPFDSLGWLGGRMEVAGAAITLIHLLNANFSPPVHVALILILNISVYISLQNVYLAQC